MEHPLLSFQCLLHISFILLLLSNHLTYASQLSSIDMAPRLSPIGDWDTILHHHATQLAPNYAQDFETFYYNQTLDHFNYRPESYTKFPQRYLINSKYWNVFHSSAPIFVYFGAEGAIDGDLWSIGFLTENAASFNALILYIEHRYYGESNPFGSSKMDEEKRGYFNSAQALADYAEVILHVKKTYNAHKSPVIVIGGSYGGMLASWFRLKYPHLAIGALASSAPVIFFYGLVPSNTYYSIVTRDFREASENCYETIKKSWSEIDKVASQPYGLFILSRRFNTCLPLTSASALKYYLRYMYAIAAQYNSPTSSYPVSKICSGIDGAPGSDIIDKIVAGVEAYKGKTTCKFNALKAINITTDWEWQICSEMVMPMGSDNTTMFESAPFNLKTYMDNCKYWYGVSTRPHWATTYYGGHHFKKVLKRFGATNIIFSNGLQDPYSGGGILENISESLVSLVTAKGSHCLDILFSQPTDPEWLKKQREDEVKIIRGWISQYYAHLHAHYHLGPIQVS